MVLARSRGKITVRNHPVSKLNQSNRIVKSKKIASSQNTLTPINRSIFTEIVAISMTSIAAAVQTPTPPTTALKPPIRLETAVAAAMVSTSSAIFTGHRSNHPTNPHPNYTKPNPSLVTSFTPTQTSTPQLQSQPQTQKQEPQCSAKTRSQRYAASPRKSNLSWACLYPCKLSS